MTKKSIEPVVRVIIKLPKSLAAYFRSEFHHGQRSDFVAKKILEYRHAQEVEKIEDELRKANRGRQAL